MLLPLQLLISVLLGLLSVLILTLAIYLLYRAVQKKQRRVFIRPKLDPPTEKAIVLEPAWTDMAVLGPLAAGLLLILFGMGGRHMVELAFPAAPDDAKAVRGGAVQNVQGVGGANLHVESYGPTDGPVMVFTHGWGMTSTEWFYAKRDLGDRFRLILWDLPGLGQSSRPDNGDFGLETMARDLHAVIGVANGKPMILVGHSIGGMINLTFCRLFPEQLGHGVTAIIQVDTSYTNPVKTTSHSGLSQALQKPVAEPILYGMIGLSPLIHIMNWFTYENGITDMMNAKSAFAGAETRGQLDLVSRMQTEASPGVVARGTLAMFHWDATPVLPTISVPVLLLVGQQDTTTLPSASETMHAKIPGSKLVVVSPSAHYSLLEQNQKIDSEIRNFASEQFPGSR